MENNLLKNVIEVEQEIGRTLEDEESKAAAWLKAVLDECRTRTEDEKCRIDQQFQQEFSHCRRAAEQEAQDLLAAARLRTTKLESIKAGYLAGIISRHLTAILPDAKSAKKQHP